MVRLVTIIMETITVGNPVKTFANFNVAVRCTWLAYMSMASTEASIGTTMVILQ